MTAYNFGDVILVPFPFTDQSQAKQRPAAVVSSARYNTERPDLILMAITSQVRLPATFGEVLVQHWQAVKLLKPSAIKPIFTTALRRPDRQRTLVWSKEQPAFYPALNSSAPTFGPRSLSCINLHQIAGASLSCHHKI
jgi:mRNA interferase MazF